MLLETIFSGGCADSELPRKGHLLDPETRAALCGQHFSNQHHVECSDIDAEDFIGSEACKKCLSRKAALILRVSPNA